MKTKLHNLILLFGLMVLPSCAVGPTAFLADGSRVTLGGSLLTEAQADARQANMNGAKLSWVRTGVNETGVAKAGLGAWAFGKGVAGYTKNVAAKEATKQVNAVEGTKQAQIAADAATAGTALEKSATTTSNVTAPGVTIIQPK